MGYIPPIRNEQLFQYGNRIPYDQPSIKPISAVAKSKFHEVLTEQQKQINYTILKNEYNRRKFTNRKLICELTGKGYIIDASV
ncbi:hypothetical protein BKP37_17665 [Anaerobacillus alkalilacustris]|uniref:Uncharacterized protein n=1 Tax=Anaerobacillus alkalilacustris TaxID=393763 RepID=A0A1S2LFU7_9BACI|nr:hypothetical protein [Anaerobacillus alkalilacustris]OIJ10375.1 hypothetical protein BKP37_17665 [Anaerobacillus alkalilacustris]